MDVKSFVKNLANRAATQRKVVETLKAAVESGSVSCADCAYQEGFYDGVIACMAIAISDGGLLPNNDAGPKWISVLERLPTAFDADKDGDVFVRWRESDIWRACSTKWGQVCAKLPHTEWLENAFDNR